MVRASNVHPSLFCHSHIKQDRRTVIALARRRESPSAGSKLSALLDTQRIEREDAIHNYRPPNLVGPPIQIFNPAFAMFIREMSKPYDTMEFTAGELSKALDFIDVSLDYYTDESYRRSKVDDLQVLGRLDSLDKLFDPKSTGPAGIVTVMCPTGKREAVICLIEMKNEIGLGGSDPIAQAECGYVLICSSNKVTSFLSPGLYTQSPPFLLQYELFRSASCCPMFLVGIAGPHLTVSGAIFTDRFISQRLTDYIHIGPLPTFQGKSSLDHSIRRVAQVLRALNQATEELERHYTGLKFEASSPYKSRGYFHHAGPPPPPVPSRPLPQSVVPPSFQEFTVDSKTYMIGYEHHLSSASEAVFKGTITCDGDQASHAVIVKFTSTYCADAHRKLAEANRAPRLWFCEQVQSVGMYIVVMDYENGTRANPPLEDKDRIEELRMAVEMLHGENYVHGDIRGPNVLITTNGVKLIDFDWCGKEGEVCYPADISVDASDIGWHRDVRRGCLIEKGHDEHMFTLLTSSPYRTQGPTCDSPSVYSSVTVTV